MKKIYFLITALVITMSAGAQSNRMDVSAISAGAEHLSKTPVNVLSVDTMFPSSFSDSCYIYAAYPLVLYPADKKTPRDSGFMFGNNYYGDLEKAQKYHLNGNGAITSVGVIFAKKTPTAGTVTIKVYGIDPGTLGPDNVNVLGTSNPVTISNFATKGKKTIFTFPTPVVVSDMDFALSVILPKNGVDTVGIGSTQFGCNSGDSLSWEKYSDGIWYAVSHDFNGANLDLAIFPIINNAIGIQQASGFTTTTVAYPNPAASNVTISYTLAKAENVSIDVFDIAGKKVASLVNNKSEISGKHDVVTDLTSFQAGSYLYSITTGSGRSMGKFNVIK